MPSTYNTNKRNDAAPLNVYIQWRMKGNNKDLYSGVQQENQKEGGRTNHMNHQAENHALQVFDCEYQNEIQLLQFQITQSNTKTKGNR
jgi:hypothetical protein